MRFIQVDSNQLVDSNVKPDIISIVSSASRRKIKDDVIVLVTTAKMAKKTTTSNMAGVSIKQPIVENTNGIIFKDSVRKNKCTKKKEKRGKKDQTVGTIYTQTNKFIVRIT